jgi:hypothetical protein
VIAVVGESYERYVAAIDTARETIQSSSFIRDAADRALGDQFLRAVARHHGRGAWRASAAGRIAARR